jgi:hypothetical protein
VNLYPCSYVSDFSFIDTNFPPILNNHQIPDDDCILDKAKKIVNVERKNDYGDLEKNFKIIANMWSAYLGQNISTLDFCNMMILLKTARCKTGFHEDSLIDICGYSYCAEKLQKSNVDGAFGV